MTTKKTVIATASALLAAGVVLAPSLVSADDMITETNEDTGFRSTNRNDTRINRRSDQRRTDRADATNRARITANTGGNESNKNTDGGEQTSGMVDVDAMVTNTLNQSDAELTPPDEPAADVDLTNSNTGVRSTNTNDASIRSRHTTRLRKLADVTNRVTVDATTGENESNQNTTGGDQTSGDVVVTLTFTNEAN